MFRYLHGVCKTSENLSDGNTIRPFQVIIIVNGKFERTMQMFRYLTYNFIYELNINKYNKLI